jgi:hypothetical protein
MSLPRPRSDQTPPKAADGARLAWWATSAVPYRWFWLLALAGVPIGLVAASLLGVPVWLGFICAELPALGLEAWWRGAIRPRATHRG